MFALLGENGAGKTTAIRIMLGLAQPNSGQAEVLGLSSAKQGLSIRQRVGYVAERPTFYDWMTVEEIGWFTAGFYGDRIPAGSTPAGRPIRHCRRKKKLKTLSKGMRAKVALSLALAHQPELLVLDEPTSGLDAMVRREFLESMVDRAAQGQTVFLSSHQIVEVERVADIVAILRKGKLLLVEPLDELKAQVRRLTVTLKDGATTTPALGGHVLSQRWQPRQGQAIVRGITEGQLAMLPGRRRRRRRRSPFDQSGRHLHRLHARKRQRMEPAIAPEHLAGGRTTMTPSIFWRVVWKEYRLQRSLWIAMAALTAILQLLVIAYEPPHQARAETLYLLALAFPALYALGCGATLFAGEREAGTYEFQRSLPVCAWAVFVGKIVLALGSTLAMLGLMVGFATFLSKPTPPGTVDVATWRVMAWQVFGFFGLEMFVWAVLFSFATKRVLLAAILGVAAASIGAHLAVAIVTTQGAVATYVDALPWRMVIAAGVALADVSLAARWFREKRGRQPKFVPATAAETPPEAIALGRRFQQPQRMAILGRLIWQHWRQSRGVSLAMAALIVPLLAMLMMWLLPARENPPWFIERHASEIYRPGDKEFFALTILIALASVPLLGICAFLADQRRSSRRFLADHGVPAKYVRLSRQTITLGLPLLMFFTLLLALFFLASAPLPSPLQSDIIRWARLSEVYAEAYTLFYFAVGVLGCVLIGVAVGQCCSMFLRSPLLAGLFQSAADGPLRCLVRVDVVLASQLAVVGLADSCCPVCRDAAAGGRLVAGAKHIAHGCGRFWPC